MKPTAEQQQILGHLRGALRIAAGAGTGKTDTLRRAIVTLIEGGARPGEILCLTFTVEATQEMRRRVLAEFGDRSDLDADEIAVQTYHAFAASIVHDHALLLGLEQNTRLLDQAQKWQLMREALEQCSFDKLEIRWLPNFITGLLNLHDEIQRHDLSLSAVADACREGSADEVFAKRLEAVGALEHYVKLKLERNAIDFGDQIMLANRVLRQRGDVLDRLRQRFRYVFLDEYQDTDVAQRALVQLIGTDADLVCAVGDVDQGIFGWRGASIHNMFAFPDDFPGARTDALSLNFRSGQKVLDLANAIIEEFEPPEGYTRTPLRAADSARESRIEGFVASHTAEEAAGIAERIESGGPPWSQYAVLVRKRTQLNAIYTALAGRGVPVEVDTLGGFWTRPEILDVTSWLSLLADPGDNIALARILLGPCYRLSRRDLFFLASRAKEGNRRLRRDGRDILRYSLIDSIVEHDQIEELSPEARERVDTFRRTWSELATTAQRVSLADLVGEIARVSGLAQELAASPDPEADMARHHLAKLRDLAQAYQPVAGLTDLAGFVDYLESIEESDQDEDELRAVEENTVRLMTLHRAKGLEWDVVFLPGLSDGVMPSGRTSESPAEHWYRLPFALRGDREFLPDETKEGIEQIKFEEERRLMYVGVTRARHRLVLSRAHFYWDNKRPKPASPFWDEAVPFMDTLAQCEPPDENPHPVAETLRLSRPRPEIVRDETEVARIEGELDGLRAAEQARPRAMAWRLPSALSVTAFLTFMRDEEEFFWRYVRRVPGPPSPAAELGVELHRRIEQHARGAVALGAPEEAESPYDLDPGERRGNGKAVSADELWANFQGSRFAAMTPHAVEQPFTLYIGEGISLEGRIDAIFERDDGAWEIVDYKTGSSDPDPLQLAIYARAVQEIWGKEAVPLWLLLRDGRESAPAPADGLDELLADAARRVRASR